jgi:MFS family permease
VGACRTGAQHAHRRPGRDGFQRRAAHARHGAARQHPLRCSGWWTPTSFLVFAGLLLLAGAPGDRYGRKRLLVLGLVFFGTASAAVTSPGSTG